MSKTMKGLTHNAGCKPNYPAPRLPFNAIFRLDSWNNRGSRSSIIVVVVVIDPRVSWPSAVFLVRARPGAGGSHPGVLDR